MALQFIVDAIDTVPEAFRNEYVEKDGKFHLNVDGAVPKARLDEFRDTNITTRKQLEELTARYDGVDPDKFREMASRDAAIREKKLIEAGKVDELVAERIATMRGDHDKAVSALSKDRDGLRGQLEGLVLDGGLRDAAAKAGVRPAAIEDVLARGRQTYRLHEGVATAFDGDKPAYGKNGDALGMDEWMTGLAGKAAHLFEASTGGGTPKGGPTPTVVGKTVTRSSFNAMSPQDQATAARTMKVVD